MTLNYASFNTHDSFPDGFGGNGGDGVEDYSYSPNFFDSSDPTTNSITNGMNNRNGNGMNPNNKDGGYSFVTTSGGVRNGEVAFPPTYPRSAIRGAGEGVKQGASGECLTSVHVGVKPRPAPEDGEYRRAQLSYGWSDQNGGSGSGGGKRGGGGGHRGDGRREDDDEGRLGGVAWRGSWDKSEQRRRSKGEMEAFNEVGGRNGDEEQWENPTQFRDSPSRHRQTPTRSGNIRVQLADPCHVNRSGGDCGGYFANNQPSPSPARKQAPSHQPGNETPHESLSQPRGRDRDRGRSSTATPTRTRPLEIGNRDSRRERDVQAPSIAPEHIPTQGQISPLKIREKKEKSKRKTLPLVPSTITASHEEDVFDTRMRAESGYVSHSSHPSSRLPVQHNLELERGSYFPDSETSTRPPQSTMTRGLGLGFGDSPHTDSTVSHSHSQSSSSNSAPAFFPTPAHADLHPGTSQQTSKSAVDISDGVYTYDYSERTEKGKKEGTRERERERAYPAPPANEMEYGMPVARRIAAWKNAQVQSQASLVEGIEGITGSRNAKGKIGLPASGLNQLSGVAYPNFTPEPSMIDLNNQMKEMKIRKALSTPNVRIASSSFASPSLLGASSGNGDPSQAAATTLNAAAYAFDPAAYEIARQQAWGEYFQKMTAYGYSMEDAMGFAGAGKEGMDKGGMAGGETQQQPQHATMMMAAGDGVGHGYLQPMGGYEGMTTAIASQGQSRGQGVYRGGWGV